MDGCCVPYQPCWEQVKGSDPCPLLSTHEVLGSVLAFSVQKGHGQTVQSPVKATKMSKELKSSFCEERNKHFELKCRVPTFPDAYLFSYVIRWYLSLVPHRASTFCGEQWKVSRLSWKFFWDSLRMHGCCSERDSTGCNLDFLAVYEDTPKQTQKVYPTRYVSETCT